MTSPASPRPKRVVVISPVLPFDGITHAGGLYLQLLHRALVDAGAQVDFLVDASNEWALDRPGAPARVVPLGAAIRGTRHGRVLARLVGGVDRRIARWAPTWPRLPFVTHLAISPSARALIRAADVIDIQWPEHARLIPLVRRLNPRARLVITLHDVLSQRLARQAGAGSAHRAVARWALGAARRLERATLRRSDVVVVFSDKDRDLLTVNPSDRHTGRIEVVAPPLATSAVVPSHAPDRAAPLVVFVGLLDRPENGQAAIWLVEDIWPSVVDRVPTAHLQLVGSGGSARLRAVCAAGPNVELTGFVPDLDAVYARASACVIPLTQGAGVKFKTVEALVAGVPTVTTAVGAEGVGGPERFAAVADDAGSIASALVRVLQDPDVAEAAAHETSAWARERYDVAHFTRDVERIYELGS